MSEEMRDGGPVHPWTEQIRCGGHVVDEVKHEGITLRQYYAGQAAMANCGDLATVDEADMRHYSRLCWMWADAMLATEHEGAQPTEAP